MFSINAAEGTRKPGLVKKFTAITDARGSLLPIELEKEFGFRAERFYFLYDSASARGFHAHRVLQQVVVALKGSCNILLDDGQNKQEYLLDSKYHALFIDKGLWR